ncbi:hypothetical protein BCR35DRAFT_304539 [Leucosporidium creatinivorum]|uniref:F-box domain-containing protein n=1 Tax=Leucosporidium creatinivorum TaxID=106004 RepID=A0A1Y2F734_9BASI|nr:hypothetical protein BCR35DRAFT_304539 [Leucosporidium creatinivorum]
MKVQDEGSSPKPAKRPRKATSTRRQRRAKATSFPLFDLPTELVTYILDLVDDTNDLEALSWSCRTFYRACRRRALLARFPVGGQLSRIAYCLEGAKRGEPGWKPFTILGCFKPENGKDVHIEVAEHDVTKFESESPTFRYLLLQWTESEVYLRHVCRDCLDDPAYHRLFTLSWRKQARGRLLKMTSALMNERFVCPECGGSRVVELGSYDLEDRWPDLEAGSFPPILAPCPRCTISYNEITQLHHQLFHIFDEVSDEDAFYDRFASPSPSCSDDDFPRSPSSSTSTSRCSSVSSSDVDENEYPPRLFHGESDDEAELPPPTFHGESDAEGDELEFPSSTHSDLSDAESTEYASLQDDNLDDDDSEESEKTPETELSIDFEAEWQEEKRARELERQEFERRGWGELLGKSEEFEEAEEMEWEWDCEEEMELPERNRRPEGPSWVEGYAYDYGNGWFWAPPDLMRAHPFSPRYGAWNDGRWRQDEEEQSSVGEWRGDARAWRADWY